MLNFLTRLLNFRTIENPTVPLTSDNIAELFDGGLRSESGIIVNNKTAMTCSAVYKAVTTLSRDAAKLPWITYKRTPAGRERDPLHPAFPILRHKANEFMLAYTFRQTLMHHALMHGNGYGWIFRDGNAAPLEMMLLDPITTEPKKINGKLWYIVKVDHQDRQVRPEDIFHLKGLGFDGLRGWSVLTLARESLGLSLGRQRYESKFFSNSARPSGVLEHPGKLGEGAEKNLKSSWNKMYQGLDNSHRTAILEEGMQFKPLSINAKDAQLIEGQEFGIRQIANWFSIPPHMLGDPTRTSFKSLEQEKQSYLDSALDPWLVNLEEEARDKLLTEDQKRTDSHFAEFKREALVRIDILTRFRAHSIALGGAPFKAVNEVRGEETLDDKEGHDEIVMPLNMSADPNASADSEDDEDDEDEEADGARRNEHAALIRSMVGKAVRSAGLYAVRASRKPKGFNNWIDGDFSEKNEPVIRKMLDLPIRACSTLTGVEAGGLLDRATSKILDDLRAGMLRISGECRAADLEAGITALFEESVARLGETVANEILNGESDDA